MRQPKPGTPFLNPLTANQCDSIRFFFFWWWALTLPPRISKEATSALHATTRFLRKGGGQGPPLTFQRGGLFEKRGGQIFFVRPLPQKLILHHTDTFVMQVSWIGSKQSNEIIIFIITTMIFYSMIYVILVIEKT